MTPRSSSAGPAAAVAGPAPARRVRPGRSSPFRAPRPLVVVLGASSTSPRARRASASATCSGCSPGSGDDEALAVLVASRAPRVLAALLVGVALGCRRRARCSRSPATRWPRRTPSRSTPARTCRSWSSRRYGIALPFRSHGGLAFVGGLAAAGAGAGRRARRRRAGPTRLVLAGSATMLALAVADHPAHAAVRAGHHGAVRVGRGLDRAVRHRGGDPGGARWCGRRAACSCCSARRLDVLALGDDTAAVLGLDVRRTRVVAVLLAVLLAAVAVTVAGPIGFVGLTAPVIARLVAGRVPGAGAGTGCCCRWPRWRACVVVLGADVLLRLAVPGVAGVVEVPTGVVTTLFGAVGHGLAGPAAARRRSGTPAPPPCGAHPASRVHGRASWSACWSRPSSPRSSPASCWATGCCCSATWPTGSRGPAAGR